MTATIRPDGALDVEQIVLPGQTAAPAGPVDPAGMYLMHHAFRRDLALFTAATAATPAGDQACWKRLQRRWALFSGALHKHHHGEDSGLWPLLLERTAGGEDAAVLRAMADEHEHIYPLLQACGAGFAGMAAGTAGAREVLAGHVTELRDRLEATSPTRSETRWRSSRPTSPSTTGSGSTRSTSRRSTAPATSPRCSPG